MPAWSEARRLSSAMSSQAAKKDGTVDDNPAVNMLRDWFKRIYKRYNPDKHRCIFNGKDCAGKVTTGLVPGFGAVWKCQGHRAEYEEVKSAFEETDQ